MADQCIQSTRFGLQELEECTTLLSPWSTGSQKLACWSQNSTGHGVAAGARAEGQDT